ncbi:MAG: ABC transporter ATP-binding protein [Lachnospirales bacterium]
MNILDIKNLSKHYKDFIALNSINLSIKKGEVLSIVGESGSGKTTLGKLCNNLISPTKGEVFFEGKNIFKFSKKEDISFRKKTQFILQNPKSTLNPYRDMEWIVKEPMRAHGFGEKEINRRLEELFPVFDLSMDILKQHSATISGGQGQRILILASLLLKPQLLICDEIVSALDVSVQIKILNLIKKLQKEEGLTIIFITHDLSVAEYISDRIVVMENGKIVESGTNVLSSPKEEYTRNLIRASQL